MALVAALAWLGLLAALLAARGGDFTRFAEAGDYFADAARAPLRLHVRPDSYGYDGQFFLRLALDPWTDREDAHGIRLDRAPYRQQRILLPALAHGLSLSRPAAAPAALVATNLLALVLVARLGAAWLGRAGADPWTGLACSLYPGLALAFARDLAEPVEAAAIVAGLALLRTPHAAWAALPLSLAVLARETSVLVVAAVGLAWLPWPRGWLPAWRAARPPTVVWLAPLATFAAWQAWIAARWDVTWVLGVSGRGLRKSSLAVFDRLGAALGGRMPDPALSAVEIVGLLALAATLLVCLARSRATAVEKLAALLLGVLLFSRDEAAWIEDWGFLRLSSAFWIVSLGVLAQGPAGPARWAPRLGLVAWLVVSAHALFRILHDPGAG